MGRIRGEEIELLRAEFSAEEPRDGFRIARVRSATVTWEDGTVLGEPLERLLGWRVDEPVVLAVPTPALAGESLEIPVSLGAPITDERELLHRARWEVREDVRELTSRYFGCSLEDVAVVAEHAERRDVEALPGSALVRVTCLARAAGDTESLAPPDPAPPPDIRNCQLVLLPLLLGTLLPPAAGPVGLFLFEERQVTFLVRESGVLKWIRTLPVGGELLFRQLATELRCTPKDAAILLARSDGGTLAAEPTRVLVRVLRPLLPLFSGALRVFSEELPQELRVADLLVGGLWPALVSRVFLRPQFRTRCTLPRAVPRVLPLSPVFERDAEPSSGAPPPGARLLRHMIDAVVREDGGEVPTHATAAATVHAPVSPRGAVRSHPRP